MTSPGYTIPPYGNPIIDTVVDEIAAEYGSNVDEGHRVPIEVLAAKVAARLEESHREELIGWLLEHEDNLLRFYIGRRLQGKRPQAPSKASAFAEAIAQPELLAEFATPTFDTDLMLPDGTTRKVRDMTGDDHFALADRYQAVGTTTLMLAAFHRQLGKTLGKRKTGEAMTEVHFLELLGRVKGAFTTGQ